MLVNVTASFKSTHPHTRGIKEQEVYVLPTMTNNGSTSQDGRDEKWMEMKLYCFVNAQKYFQKH